MTETLLCDCSLDYENISNTVIQFQPLLKAQQRKREAQSDAKASAMGMGTGRASWSTVQAQLEEQRPQLSQLRASTGSASSMRSSWSHTPRDLGTPRDIQMERSVTDGLDATPHMSAAVGKPLTRSHSAPNALLSRSAEPHSSQEGNGLQGWVASLQAPDVGTAAAARFGSSAECSGVPEQELFELDRATTGELLGRRATDELFEPGEHRPAASPTLGSQHSRAERALLRLSRLEGELGNEQVEHRVQQEHRRAVEPLDELAFKKAQEAAAASPRSDEEACRFSSSDRIFH